MRVNKSKAADFVSQWFTSLPASAKSKTVLQIMTSHFISVGHKEMDEGSQMGQWQFTIRQVKASVLWDVIQEVHSPKYANNGTFV